MTNQQKNEELRLRACACRAKYTDIAKGIGYSRGHITSYLNGTLHSYSEELPVLIENWLEKEEESQTAVA